MKNTILLSKLEENIKWFKKMYDSVRLVDPIKKKVIDYQHCTIDETNSICYDFWGKEKVCDNCISTRAYLYNKCFVKLQQTDHSVMMVTAMPVEGAEQPIIIELLKNVTDSMTIESAQLLSEHSIQSIVAQLNDLITKDELTGLYNRRYIDERLPADIVKATLTDQSLSTIFMDLDNLKEINDNFGHIYGDMVINEIAGLISDSIGDGENWAARYGGDEFFICLNHTNEDEAYQIAEKIRRKTAELKIQSNRKTISTTASLGVYTIQKSSDLTAEEVIALVDNRMYEAKKLGKNNTVAFNRDN